MLFYYVLFGSASGYLMNSPTYADLSY